MYSRTQLFALLQRAACNAGALDIAPYQLIRIEVRRVPRQEVQGQFALLAGDVVLESLTTAFLCAGSQSINNQMDRLPAFEHQLAEQLHEQLAGQSAFVRCKPEGTLRVDRRRCAHALPLARAFDNRRFTARRPDPAMHRVSAKNRFDPEENICVFDPRPNGDGWMPMRSAPVAIARNAIK